VNPRVPETYVDGTLTAFRRAEERHRPSHSESGLLLVVAAPAPG
jgi:hypothetical protein